MVVVAVHSVAVVALVATAVVTVLNHAVRLALKATVVATVSKVVVIALKTAVHLHPVLKVVAILALRAVSNPVAISAANNAALRLAAKVALNPVAISAKTLAVKTVLTLETPAPLAHPVVSTRVAVPAIVLHAVLKSSVLATSSLTMLAVTPHPSALAPRC